MRKLNPYNSIDYEGFLVRGGHIVGHFFKLICNHSKRNSVAFVCYFNLICKKNYR